MLDLTNLRHFVAVYQAGSFTAAALRLGVSKVAVAKRIGALEQHQGVRLFQRSTRRVVATQEADQMYGYVLELLQQAEDLEQRMANRSPMQGLVRVTCPLAVAHAFAGDLLARFRERHPGLEVHLIATDSVLDLVEHNVDLAIRVGDMVSSSLVGRKLGPNALLACAAPSYLARSKPLRRLADLKQHSVLCMTYHLNARFRGKGLSVRDVIGEQHLATNEGLLVTRLGARGYGVVIRSRWSVREELESGALVPVLPAHPIEPLGDLWLLASAGRLRSPRVRAVFEMLLAESKAYLDFRTS
ncbi:MAG TPA: LysR family transcriptional regulator [Polyangiaceae bacterium]|jgi:DNA-binding transcriptional LysR family regulator|nr:LysR family transcriptional regulator [Polyangiaceae bacterium]